MASDFSGGMIIFSSRNCTLPIYGSVQFQFQVCTISIDLIEGCSKDKVLYFSYNAWEEITLAVNAINTGDRKTVEQVRLGTC